MGRVVKLPSGKELEIEPSPFKEARALYQAVLEEVKGLKLDPKAEVDVNLWKDLFCVGFSSKKVETCLMACMKFAKYDGLKITDDIFEPVEARDDYMTVCMEVAKENIMPFMKSLYAQYAPLLSALQPAQV